LVNIMPEHKMEELGGAKRSKYVGSDLYFSRKYCFQLLSHTISHSIRFSAFHISKERAQSNELCFLLLE
jgi:hypothetical protein